MVRSTSGMTCRGVVLAAAAAVAQLLPSAVRGAEAAEGDSTGGMQTFTFTHDLFASDTGYYLVDGKGPSPELQMKANVTYKFDQSDATNWYHPLGFAFLPDGAHSCLMDGGCPEVEGPGLKYFIDGKLSTLDDYEPAFEAPREEWMKHRYHVELNLDAETLETAAETGEIFYFCHLHMGMSGLIKVQDQNGQPMGDVGKQAELYKPYQADEFDKMCGTYEVSEYAPGEGYAKECADLQFLCGETDTSFGKCMQAIDCKMNRSMRVINSGNPVVTFMHQMIPHHDNAVNMAKILLKIEESKKAAGDATVLEDGAFNIIDQDVDDLLRNIVNTQNEQITFMNSWLEENGHAPYDRRGGWTWNQVALCPPGPATGNEVASR